MVYYNDNDPYCIGWMKNLIAAGMIPWGIVDDRPIQEVTLEDVSPYTQCHFFAGIGGWPYALRLAGWPDDRPVWTGSCPCQPFSAAGKREGTKDKRHLWPEFRRLIAECRPSVVFGEQVASKDGRLWLAGVRTDLEELGYALGAADLCAAGGADPDSTLGGIAAEAIGEVWCMLDTFGEIGNPKEIAVGLDRIAALVVGSPHIRQRLWWVADSTNAVGLALTDGRDSSDGDLQRGGEQRFQQTDGSSGGRLADRFGQRLEERAGQPGDAGEERQSVERDCDASGVGNAEYTEWRTEQQEHGDPYGRPGLRGTGFWSNFDLIPCLDGKARRVEPGTFPLVHGVPDRVGKLRAYGNAIVPQVAAEVIRAYVDCFGFPDPRDD